MIIESERSGKTISDIVLHLEFQDKHGTNGRTQQWYGIDGLKNQSKRPHNKKHKGDQRTGKDYPQAETK